MVITMTLIVALKYKNSVVLASDSRVMYGPIKRDQARKLEPLTEILVLPRLDCLER